MLNWRLITQRCVRRVACTFQCAPLKDIQLGYQQVITTICMVRYYWRCFRLNIHHRKKSPRYTLWSVTDPIADLKADNVVVYCAWLRKEWLLRPQEVFNKHRQSKWSIRGCYQTKAGVLLVPVYLSIDPNMPFNWPFYTQPALDHYEFLERSTMLVCG